MCFKDCAQGGQIRRLAYNEFKQGQHLMGVFQRINHVGVQWIGTRIETSFDPKEIVR